MNVSSMKAPKGMSFKQILALHNLASDQSIRLEQFRRMSRDELEKLCDRLALSALDYVDTPPPPVSGVPAMIPATRTSAAVPPKQAPKAPPKA